VISSVRKLVFIRHGITTIQEEGRYCGHLDPPLSEKGKSQAAAVAARLRDFTPGCVFGSDLRRCVETAALISPCRLFQPLAEFREIAFGEYEGRTYTEVAQQVLEPLSDPDCRFPAGESLRILSARVSAGMDKVLAACTESVVVIAHAGSIAAAILLLLRRSLDHFWSYQLPHGGVAVIVNGPNGWCVDSADWRTGQK
jgi:alpha-ribazole phosphatase